MFSKKHIAPLSFRPTTNNRSPKNILLLRTKTKVTRDDVFLWWDSARFCEMAVCGDGRWDFWIFESVWVSFDWSMALSLHYGRVGLSLIQLIFLNGRVFFLKPFPRITLTYSLPNQRLLPCDNNLPSPTTLYRNVPNPSLHPRCKFKQVSSFRMTNFV